MPKLKTHKGAKKRFKVSARGKVSAKSASSRHLLAKKSRANKRHKGGMNHQLTVVEGKKIKTLLAGQF